MQRATNRAGTRPDRKILVVLVGFKALEDRAMRAMVPMAGIHQHGERVGHVLQNHDLLLQRVDMALFGQVAESKTLLLEM